jgi:hypothetical protein
MGTLVDKPLLKYPDCDTAPDNDPLFIKWSNIFEHCPRDCITCPSKAGCLQFFDRLCELSSTNQLRLKEFLDSLMRAKRSRDLPPTIKREVVKCLDSLKY